MVLEKKKRLGGMKRLDKAAHWELRKGTHEQAKNTVKKKKLVKMGLGNSVEI